MNILIWTNPNDTHAVAVKLLMERRGHSVSIFCMSDFPSNLSMNLSMSNGGSEALVRGHNGGIEQGAFDVVLIRKMGKAVVSNALHENDRNFARAEADVVAQSIHEFFDSSGIFWVNPHQGLRDAKLKSLQLKFAREAGLNIPDTLISNDPERVLSFCKNNGGCIVVKNFFPALWVDIEKGHKISMTKLIDTNTIEINRLSIRFCPSIFQRYIKKKYEIRIVVMGETMFSGKIDSHFDDSMFVDWRNAQNHGIKFPLEPILIPDSIANKIVKFMKSMNLVFGCIDLIYSNDESYYFLEVNPFGQFLWMEMTNSEFPLLTAFCDFLESQDGNFIWDGSHAFSYNEFSSEELAQERARVFAECVERPSPYIHGT